MKRLSILVLSLLAMLGTSHTNVFAQDASILKPACEKVFILTDREVYAPGDTIVFKGYIADPTEAPVSRYLYVELLNQSLDRNGEAKKNFMPKVLEWAKVYEIDGAYNGALFIPESLSDGTYIIRAYTRAQKDAPGQLLFHKRILVDASSSSPDQPVSEALVNAQLAQAGQLWSRMDKSSFVPGQREMIQKVRFSVFTSRKKLPKKYEVGIASDDLGLYLSYKIEDGKILNPDAFANAYLEIDSEGESTPSSCRFALSIPDFYDGVSFVVNVTGSFFLYPAPCEAEFASFFDYSSTGDGSLSQVKNYHKYNDSRVKDPDDEIKADTLNTLVVAAESKP
ncbi:MAG: hypothetical protein KBS89_07185, partial [Bacteroidales bacterium]|nr:hypothetical protein [Candidatus Egerieousia equi]